MSGKYFEKQVQRKLPIFMSDDECLQNYVLTKEELKTMTEEYIKLVGMRLAD